MMSFNIASTPRLYFGAGKIKLLSGLIEPIGKQVLLVTGAKSFQNSAQGKEVLEHLHYSAILQHAIIEQEPTPTMIDEVVSKFQNSSIDVVVAIGGGSVLDAGKALAAMLPLNEPVKEYLEGVGTKTHSGIKVPYIAVPTTAGTGSEVTKNAVLSETGERGFKKSLRHDNFVPDIAIIDPILTTSCSLLTTASSGMDAFTQLLESYVSTKANTITDPLALQGLELIARSLKNAYENGENLDARSDMAMAAYLSGITLANAGLGLVNGFASSIGGYFESPHGVVCSSLMSAANFHTVRKLRSLQHDNVALQKYARVGTLFTPAGGKSDEFYIDLLLDKIKTMAKEMKIPTLSQQGIATSDFNKIVKATDNKNNPVTLDQDEMIKVLEQSFY
jgi:alcohol dehydrogenase class IV